MKIRATLPGGLIAGALFLSACAEQAARVPAVYIPSIVYKGASCNELLGERGRLANYVSHVTAAQRRAAQSDTAYVVGSLIFWPAIFGLPFTVDQSAQLAVSRGHYDAINEAILRKGCPGHPGEGAYYGGRMRGETASWKSYRGDFPPL